MRKLALMVAASALTLLSAPASAQVVNGSFETGDFTGWTVNADFTYVGGTQNGYSPEDGNYFANLGNIGCCGTVSQTVSTTPGMQYVLSYYFASNGTTPSYFDASWDGSTLAGSVLNNVGTMPWTLYQFAVTGTGSDTISFTEQNDPNYLALDNVSLGVGGVPEPATWAMMLLGFGGIGLAMRRRRTPIAQLA